MSKVRSWLIKKLRLKGLQRAVILFRVNNLLVGTKQASFEKKRKLLNKLSAFEIGEGTRIVGPIEVTGTLKTGKNCWIGKNFKVNGNGTVTIGDNCDIGPEVTFQTGGHRLGDPSRRAGEGLIFHQVVGNGVWIGGRASILNHSAIGDGVVIAGCACVTESVAPNVLVGGVPARIIRDL